MGKHRIAGVAAFALAIAGLNASAVAMADSADKASGEHCVAGLAPAGSTAVADTVTDFRCFDSLAESLDYVADRAATERSESSELATLVGVLYDKTGYGSPTLALYGSGGSCTSGATYGFPRLSDYGWNNRAESAQGRNGCAITFYADANYGGATKSCFNSCSTLGTLNNRASSVYFW